MPFSKRRVKSLSNFLKLLGIVVKAVLNCPMNCLSVFDNFVRLARKRLFYSAELIRFNYIFYIVSIVYCLRVFPKIKI